MDNADNLIKCDLCGSLVEPRNVQVLIMRGKKTFACLFQFDCVAAARAYQRRLDAEIARACRSASGGVLDLFQIAGQSIAAQIEGQEESCG